MVKSLDLHWLYSKSDICMYYISQELWAILDELTVLDLYYVTTFYHYRTHNQCPYPKVFMLGVSKSCLVSGVTTAGLGVENFHFSMPQKKEIILHCTTAVKVQ